MPRGPARVAICCLGAGGRTPRLSSPALQAQPAQPQHRFLYGFLFSLDAGLTSPPDKKASFRGARARRVRGRGSAARGGMTTYTLSHEAYCKVVLHTLKFPHASVSGALLGRK